MTWHEVFQQALDDDQCVNLDSDTMEVRLAYGCRISRDIETGDISILNTAIGGYEYANVPCDIKDKFLLMGWKTGTEYLKLHSYKSKLNRIESNIQRIISNNKPDEVIDDQNLGISARSETIVINLKKLRIKILNKYILTKNKLNEDN
jgi:hypothetical protein